LFLEAWIIVTLFSVSEFARQELRRFQPRTGTALTIGNFDGVHLGHQHLVRFLIGRADALGLQPGAVTLYPDPVRVLRPQEPMQYLTSLEERLELLQALGLKVVAPLTFTSELAELSPRAFVTMLRETMDLRLLIMGPDNAFGRNREATPEGMKALGEEMGFAVEVMPAPLTSGEESIVSATAIRRALQEGDLARVTRQLGRYYSIRGPVVGGERRGRDLGFPTANIAVTADRALPAFGVYATWAYLHGSGGEEKLQSATSIGTRPHFDGEHPSVETFIFDFDRDIYDQILRIELVERLRPELKFESLEALLQAMHGDVAKSREILTADAARVRQDRSS
jgi:riboflavin kinase / FMN adenylyltransferase